MPVNLKTARKLVGTMVNHDCPGVFWRVDKYERTIDTREVKIMAVAKGYAMVRRPRAMAYVAPLKELSLKQPPTS